MRNHFWKKLKRFSSSSLSRYILAAILARTSTSASIISIILLSRQFGADGALVGALAACLTAPHILGPLYARWIEKTHHPFILVALACVCFVGFFQLAILSFAWQSIGLTFVALLFCGACSSFMMGGLSTQVMSLVENIPTVRRQAQSWDNFTYGIALTLGPMLIAVLSSGYSVELAASFVMCLPVVAGLIIGLLPKSDRHNSGQNQKVPHLKQVVKVLWQTPTLKTTMFMTSAVSFAFAALPVVAVYYSELFQQGRESSAYLVTLYGVGCLCGATALVVKPLASEPLILLKKMGCILLGCLALLCLSHSFTASMFAYWVCGVFNSVFFAVTIAARIEYAPAQGAAQIFMWIAAAKITAASIGAFVAGILVDHFIILPLLASISLLSVIWLICFVRVVKSS